jgi:hypothetical protein
MNNKEELDKIIEDYLKEFKGIKGEELTTEDAEKIKKLIHKIEYLLDVY